MPSRSISGLFRVMCCGSLSFGNKRFQPACATKSSLVSKVRGSSSSRIGMLCTWVPARTVVSSGVLSFSSTSKASQAPAATPGFSS